MQFIKKEKGVCVVVMDSLNTFIIASLEQQRKRTRSIYEKDTEISWENSCKFIAYMEQFKDKEQTTKTLEVLMDTAFERNDQDGTSEGYKNRMLVMFQQWHIEQLQAKVDQSSLLVEEQRKQLVVLQPIREILDTNKMLEENVTAMGKEIERLEGELKRMKTVAEEKIAYSAVLFRKEAEERRQKRLVVINEGHTKVISLFRALHESLLACTVKEKDVSNFVDKFIEFSELVRLQNEFN